jgi:hypothetical protein
MCLWSVAFQRSSSSLSFLRWWLIDHASNLLWRAGVEINVVLKRRWLSRNIAFCNLGWWKNHCLETPWLKTYIFVPLFTLVHVHVRWSQQTHAVSQRTRGHQLHVFTGTYNNLMLYSLGVMAARSLYISGGQEASAFDWDGCDVMVDGEVILFFLFMAVMDDRWDRWLIFVVFQKVFGWLVIGGGWSWSVTGIATRCVPEAKYPGSGSGSGYFEEPGYLLIQRRAL